MGFCLAAAQTAADATAAAEKTAADATAAVDAKIDGELLKIYTPQMD